MKPNPSAQRIVVGLDPGSAQLGWAVIEVSPKGLRALDAGVLLTQKQDRKEAKRDGVQVLYAYEDDYRRSLTAAQFLWGLVDRWSPFMIASEEFSPPRNARTAGQIARIFGIYASIESQRRIPIARIPPQDLKEAVTGDRSASKEEISEALDVKDPGFRALMASVVPGKREHAYDALGAAHTAVSKHYVSGV